MTTYEAMLLQRSKIWGLLCRSRGEGTDVQALYEHGDRTDVAGLLDRLESRRLVSVNGDRVQLTAQGDRAAARTFREGHVPAIVMHSPNDWRQRAWQSMRIYRGFTAEDIARICDAPSYNIVQRYCRELVENRILRHDGNLTNGVKRQRRYRLIKDVGPDAPRSAPPRRRLETRRGKHWRNRGWSAIWRLGELGEAVTALDVSAAAEIGHHLAHTLLQELTEADAVMRVERRGLPSGGWEWLYLLAPDARARAERLLYRGRRRSAWRAFAWALLLGGEMWTSEGLATECDVRRATAYKLLEALVSEGYVTSFRASSDPATTGPPPKVYRLTHQDPPSDCPAVVLKHYGGTG